MTVSRVLRQCRISGNDCFIPLTQGYEAVVDAADYGLVAGRYWCVSRQPNGVVYAITGYSEDGITRTTVRLHRLILGMPDSEIDHIDRDGLNNRRSNLRLCSSAENNANSRARDGTSRFKGVRRFRNKWAAQIGSGGKRYHLGVFSSEADAALAYDVAARDRFGDFARTNSSAQSETSHNCISHGMHDRKAPVVRHLPAPTVFYTRALPGGTRYVRGPAACWRGRSLAYGSSDRGNAAIGRGPMDRAPGMRGGIPRDTWRCGFDARRPAFLRRRSADGGAHGFNVAGSSPAAAVTVTVAAEPQATGGVGPRDAKGRLVAYRYREPGLYSLGYGGRPQPPMLAASKKLAGIGGGITKPYQGPAGRPTLASKTAPSANSGTGAELRTGPSPRPASTGARFPLFWLLSPPEGAVSLGAGWRCLLFGGMT